MGDNSIGEALWQLWLIYWVSGAAVGAFIGTMTAFGVRALIRKVIKWYKEED